MPRFYCNQPLAKEALVQLPHSVLQHLKVVHAKVDQSITLFNGDGNNYLAALVDINRHSASAKVLQSVAADTQSALHTHLALVLSKGERFEQALQKATELGVTEITPLFSERCQVKLSNQRLEKRLQHWQKIVISACEQCGRCTIPAINNLQTFPSFIQQCSASSLDLRILLAPTATHSLATVIATCKTVDQLSIVIGAEGGFTTTEVDQSINSGFQLAGLGRRILRTETAPVAALAIIQSMLGDLR